MATTPIPAGQTLPNYEDPLGVAANYAKQFYSSNGTPKESNPPKPPANAPNSAQTTQQNGSSLPKAAQGVVANTIISINNAIPAHGCSIKLPVMFDKIEIQFKQLFQSESNRLQEFVTWLTGSLSPLVETIKQAVKAIKDRINEIMKYVEKLQKIIKEIQEFIQEVQQLIAFMMSLPARLMQLVANCLSALQSSLTTMVTTSLSANSASSKASTSNATKTNSTSETYKNTTLPTVNTQ